MKTRVDYVKLNRRNCRARQLNVNVIDNILYMSEGLSLEIELKCQKAIQATRG